jgi:hypothetical protein
MSVGTLTVRLGLDAAEFISGMTKSEVQAKKFADNLDRNIAAGIVKAQIALEALGAGVRIAADSFKMLTTGAAEFKDLEESTGASAESIASLAISAATAGVEISDVAGAANKLTKNLVGVDDESKAAGAALKAIGINIQEFKALDPVGQYEAVGKALGAFADGSEKVAVAQALFGKTGPEQLRVFKALEEAGGAQVILTQKQIELADEYADRQAKSAATLRLYAQAAATQAIPALTDLTNATVEFVKELIGVDKATSDLKQNTAIKDFADSAVDALAFLGDAGDGVVRTFQIIGKALAADAAIHVSIIDGEFKAALRIAKEASSDIDDILSRKTFRERLAEQRAKRAAAENTGPDPNQSDAETARLLRSGGKPKIKFNGADTAGAGILKKQLDGQLKAIREFAQQERDAYDFANKFVKGTYDDGLISLQQFFDEQSRIRDAGLASQLQALDKEKAALQAALPKSKDADRVDIENKIAEVVAKRAEAVAKAGRDGVLSAQEEARALKQLHDRYDDLRASILQLSGDSAGASRIRITQQVEEARKLIAQTGGDPAGADQLNALLTGTEALNQAQKDYGLLVDRARNAEDALLLVATERGTSEFDTLVKVGEERKKALEQLSAMVDRANELALALGTPDAIQFAERLGLAFKKATAEVDPLLQRIKEVGSEVGQSIANSFEDAIVSGKGLREILKGLESDLLRILARNLITKPLGDQISNWIGGNGQASGGGGFIGGLSGLFGGAGSAGGAAGSGSAWGDAIASIFGGGKAIGGPTSPNTLYQVAERRPEVYSDGSGSWLLTGSRHGSVDPNPTFAGGRHMTVNQTFVVQGTPNRNTQTQIYAESARGVSRAAARNN